MDKNKFGVGIIIMVAVTLIVGVILFQSAAQNLGEVTNTISVANQSLGDVSADDVVYITNYRSISDVVVYNESEDAIVDAEYYTIANNVVYNGALAIKVTAAADVGDYDGHAWTISGTGQPLTYAADSGTRSVVGLALIFFALMVAVVGLTPMRDKLADLLGM